VSRSELKRFQESYHPDPLPEAFTRLDATDFKLCFADGVHLADTGHRVVLEAIVQQLRGIAVAED
jgi:lysophospholipase L1-like esterase